MKLEHHIKIAFASESVTFKRLSIVKKSNKFESGDIVIPKGCIDNVDKELLSRIRKKLFEELNAADFPVNKITEDPFNCIVIYIDRTKYFHNIIKTVLKESDSYGKRLGKRDKNVLLCNDNLMKCGSKDGVVSLECLRSAVIQEHCAYLLLAHGYGVISPVQTDARQQLNDFLPPGPVTESYTNIDQSNCDTRQLSQPFLECPYVTESDTSLQREDSSKEHEGTCIKTYEFNMKKYLQDKRLLIGKNNFDKNLAVCTVCELDRLTETLQTACRLCQCCKDNDVNICVHITGQNHAFNKQKVHLTLHALMDINNRKIAQKHVVYGSVTQRIERCNSDINSAEDLFRLRYDQMRQAAILKYIEGVHGEGWASTLEALSSACIKFEMLSCVQRNTLKLDLLEEDEEGNQSTTDGSFVMYNYARLSTLFKHFDEAVAQNTYPPLPAIEEIDFKTLREEAEWSLLYNYVETFPSLVEQTIGCLEDNDSILANIHTHKISQMLCSLSRSLSSYYSRFHVLGEARSHLLPTMYARIYLLKAVHQVMENGLALMGIQPLSQL